MAGLLWMGGGLVGCCTCGVLAAWKYWRHPRRPVSVNCHFCNTDHKVSLQSNAYIKFD
jgi:hypothetical protein